MRMDQTTNCHAGRLMGPEGSAQSITERGIELGGPLVIYGKTKCPIIFFFFILSSKTEVARILRDGEYHAPKPAHGDWGNNAEAHVCGVTDLGV